MKKIYMLPLVLIAALFLNACNFGQEPPENEANEPGTDEPEINETDVDETTENETDDAAPKTAEEYFSTCGKSFSEFSASEWFPGFLEAAETMELYMISDVCYFYEQNMLAFVYWGNDPEYPGYFEDSGIYRYDIANAKLEKAGYQPGNGITNSSYWLPQKFGEKAGTLVSYEAYPVAWGCEEPPCCNPKNTYEYDVTTNVVSAVAPNPECNGIE